MIVYTRPDGGVSIVIPNSKENLEGILGPLTDAEYRKHVYDRSVPLDATDVRETDDIPTDRTYRDAWKLDGGKIVHDMGKARAIHRGRLREARKPLLAALDVEYQRADEAGDNQEKQRVAKQKQTLRDVTDDPAIEAAKTPEELKAVWPL